MPREASERLARLRSRQGDILQSVAACPEFGDVCRNRAAGEAVRYALVSMLEIDPRSTRIALKEAAKVKWHLKEGLASSGIRPDFRIQGSVPLNIHTGASDVDLLVITGTRPCGKFRKGLPDLAFGTESDDTVDYILSLRAISEEVLERHFPDSSVDRNPAKSIGLSGGGLLWKVDIVPAYWDDVTICRETQETVHRGIEIADRNAQRPIGNFPFAYIGKIEGKARRTKDGARMSVRLAKNVKDDAEVEIALSSYDIASLIYHCPDGYIMRRATVDLGILSGVERWFRELSGDRSRAVSLMTPDDTRNVLNDNSKWNGLVALSNELTSLAREVKRDLQ